MPPTCQLVQFSDRLFFTTFPAPLPPQDSLNAPGAAPSTRLVPPSPTRGIAPVSPEDDGEDQPPSYFFTLDDQLVYLSFFEDWGPFNLACVYKACILMHELIGDDTLKGHRLVLYSSDDPRRKANAALLLALFLMIVQRRTPWDAFHPIAGLEFMPFRDAGRGRSDFNLSITDCLWGVWKAIQNGLCDMNDFSVDEYEFYEKVENGDWNWITPNFIAFASPVEPAFARREKERVRAAAAAGGGAASVPPTPSGPSTSTTPGGSSAMRGRLPIPFQNCLDYFQRHNVKLVVRLNNALYDSALFEERGIEHLEMYFDDGSNPTDEIVRKFIAMSDAVIEAGGVVAVHCKAGLGRTGTLIGAYLIWKYGFTANEAIAFMRIVRPGSVVGPQQQYMYMKQLEWCKWAAVDEMRRVQAAATTAAAVPVSPATPPAEEGEEDIRMREVALVPAIVAAKQKIPPVTPSRHVAASTKLAAGPPQPRKTPQTAKRTAEDAALPEHGDDDDDDESDIDPAEEPEERTLRARATASVSPAPKPSAPVAAGKSKALAAATAVGKPKSVTAAARAATNAAKERAAKEKEHAAKEKENAAAMVPAAASGSGAGTGSSSGGVRVTRSKAAAATGTTLPTSGSNASIKPAAAAAAAAAAAPTTATAASAGASAIPKSATAASAATRTPRPVGATRRKVPGSPPGVPPSRLPTLVPSKRSYALAQEAEIDREKRTRSAAKKAAAAGEKEKDGEPAWVKNADREKVLERTPTPGATPGTGSTRPSLRNVRRRRSSFGSVDVVV